MKTAQLAAAGALALATLALAQRGGSAPAPAPKPHPAPEQPTPREPASKPGAEDAPVDLPALYFKTCDYDGNGWIGISEAKSSMNLDRAGFGVFDTDGDGRITEAEYTERYRAIISRGGAFTPPLDKIVSHRIPKRTPEELIAAFDEDKDGALDQRAVGRALVEYGATGVDAEKVMTTIDLDKSARIELSEAQALLDILVPPPKTAGHKKVASIDALFDQVEDRKLPLDATPQPPHLHGPVSTFRRLDFDHSGGISVEDLETLQRPLLIPIRTNAVIATLDLDGDGVLSRREFAAAMR